MPSRQSLWRHARTDPRSTTERRSAVLVSFFGVLAAALGVFSSYLLVTKANVAQQRDDVQGRASTLTTRQSNLERQVAELTTENNDLRTQLDARSEDTPADSGIEVVRRTLTLPLAEDRTIALSLDDGTVITGCCSGEFRYERQANTGRPQLVQNDSDVPYSTAIQTASTQEDCSKAIETSPTVTPIRPLHTGLRICARTDAGVSLLEIVRPPQRNGELRVSQKFWEATTP